MSRTLRIVLYATNGCPECDAARACLEAAGIDFVEREVKEESDALRELLKVAGEAVVPTLVAGGDVQIGFDRARYEAIIANPLPEEDDRLSVLRAVLDRNRAPALLGLEPAPDDSDNGTATAGNTSGGTAVVFEEVDELDG